MASPSRGNPASTCFYPSCQGSRPLHRQLPARLLIQLPPGAESALDRSRHWLPELVCPSMRKPVNPFRTLHPFFADSGQPLTKPQKDPNHKSSLVVRAAKLCYCRHVACTSRAQSSCGAQRASEHGRCMCGSVCNRMTQKDPYTPCYDIGTAHRWRCIPFASGIWARERRALPGRAAALPDVEFHRL